ncbi:unnamed protein product, partial [Amoebophrya sp. A25]
AAAAAPYTAWGSGGGDDVTPPGTPHDDLPSNAKNNKEGSHRAEPNTPSGAFPTTPTSSQSQHERPPLWNINDLEDDDDSDASISPPTVTSTTTGKHVAFGGGNQNNRGAGLERGFGGPGGGDDDGDRRVRGISGVERGFGGPGE